MQVVECAWVSLPAPLARKSMQRTPSLHGLKQPALHVPLIQICTETTRKRSFSCGFCLSQEPQVQQLGPDISALNKQLQQEWDHAANLHLGSVVIKKFSHREVWWTCNQCPDGHTHSWLAAVSSRSTGSGCPQCSGRKLCKHNSLATKAPMVAAYWDSEKNGCTADMVIASSNQKAHWFCSTCKHSWETRPSMKVPSHTGCPTCSKSKSKATQQPTFAQSQHPVLAEWDHERNAVEGMFPDNVTLRSSKRVHWLCKRCPLGQQHSWAAWAAGRTAKKRPTGCPFCAGKVVCKCNCLRTLYPGLALEWYSAKNVGEPDDYTAHCTYIAWWQSAEKGIWQQTINSRVIVERVQASRLQYIKDNPTS